MDILVVSQYFYPENFRINAICKNLIERGHKVTVLTGYPNYPQGEFYEGYGPNIAYDKEWQGIDIIRVKISARKKGTLNLIKNYISFVVNGNKWAKKCKQNFDICFVFEPSPITVALPAIKFKKKTGTPILFNVQDLWPESVQYMLGIDNVLLLKPLSFLTNYIYKRCDIMLCASKSFVGKIKERGININKLIYWPQFAEEQDFEADKQFCKGKGEFRVVFTGNIGEAQGLDVVIKAAKLLEAEANIKWHLVGDGRDKERLTKLVVQENLQNTVYFVDRMSEKDAFAYIKSSDCAIMTLKNNKLFELTVPAKLQTYLSAGIPIISAIDGEVKSIIKEAKCGYAVTCGKENELAEAVFDLYNSPISLRNEMGINGKKFFDENYNKDKLMDCLEEYLNKYKRR